MSLVSKERNKKKGFRRFLNSFKYSSEGLKYAYANEQSMTIHMMTSIAIIIMGFIFQISHIEWIIAFVIIGVVMGTELLNTAIEAVVDLVSPEFHPLAKIAKDTASAAVFVYSMIALVAGLMVFVPYIIDMIA
jgi:undecaprenol kinase